MAHPFKDDRELEIEDQEPLVYEERPRHRLRESANRRPYQEEMIEPERIVKEILKIQDTVDTLAIMLTEQKERIKFLENELRQIESENNIDKASRENAKKLAQIFKLSEPTEEDAKRDVLKEMDGMLSEYSEEEVDSVELVRSVRDEE